MENSIETASEKDKVISRLHDLVGQLEKLKTICRESKEYLTLHWPNQETLRVTSVPTYDDKNHRPAEDLQLNIWNEKADAAYPLNKWRCDLNTLAEKVMKYGITAQRLDELLQKVQEYPTGDTDAEEA